MSLEVYNEYKDENPRVGNYITVAVDDHAVFISSTVPGYSKSTVQLSDKDARKLIMDLSDALRLKKRQQRKEV